MMPMGEFHTLFEADGNQKADRDRRNMQEEFLPTERRTMKRMHVKHGG